MREGLRTQLLARYAKAPFLSRFHVRGRLASLPWERLISELPKSGLLASLGTGHGAVEIAATLASPTRHWIAADIDAEKLAHACGAAHGLAIEFCHGDLWSALESAGEDPVGIVAVDVLYLFPEAEHERVIAQAFAALSSGGRLFIKEMADTPAWKWRWNRVQEWLACRVLRITESREGVVGLRPAASWANLLTRVGFASVEVIPLHAGYFHPHALIVGTKP